jgi:pimeloyl-ACP methyl ester carboxylesterase
LSRGLKSEFRADGVFLGSSCQRSFVVWFRLYPEYRVCRTPPQPLPCVCMASLAFCRQSFLVVALRLVILLVILAGIPGAALISGYAPRESLPQNAGAPTGVTPAQPAVGATAPGPAQASAAPPPIPGPSRPPIVVPARTEEGTLGASSFRIDLPLGDAEALLPTAVGQRRGLSAVSGSSNAAAPFMGPVTGPAVTPLALPYPAWNHRLVVYLHGYQAQPQLFRPNLTTHAANLPSRLIEQLLARGYAVAQPGYSTGGWAIATAPADIEALRRYFTQVNGAPTATFVVGQSMGGLLAVLTLEQQWREYAGGLALCGVLTPADLIMQRAFANRVAFDAFFPGILPDVEHIPADFHMNDSAAAAVVEKALNAHPPEAELLRSLADIHSNRGLADVLVFNTFVIEDLRLKAGGNPFDNRNLIYTGTTDDNALNARVRRYAADPAALRYIAMYGSPSALSNSMSIETATATSRQNRLGSPLTSSPTGSTQGGDQSRAGYPTTPARSQFTPRRRSQSTSRKISGSRSSRRVRTSPTARLPLKVWVLTLERWVKGAGQCFEAHCFDLPEYDHSTL